MSKSKIIAQKSYEYTLLEKEDGSYLLKVHLPISVGLDVLYTLTEEDIKDYKNNPDSFLEKQIKTMTENYKDYKINYWR